MHASREEESDRERGRNKFMRRNQELTSSRKFAAQVQRERERERESRARSTVPRQRPNYIRIIRGERRREKGREREREAEQQQVVRRR